MEPTTFRITTLGCRVNHAETRDLESTLLARGLEPAARGAVADLEVIHTCSVTRAAAAKSRQAIRRAARRAAPAAPAPHVIVTGCFVGTDPAEAAVLARHGGVVAHDADDDSALIDRFGRAVDGWLAAGGPAPLPSPAPAAGPPGPSEPRDAILPLPVVPAVRPARHARAELRIQDGCDAHCTFCIIPRLRPTLRSKRVPDAVAEARRLVDLGHQEIVLTGIFIGAYGHETALRRRQTRAGTSPLADLLDAIAAVPGLQRLRISSMEPGDVTPALLDAMVANAPVVVPHLHLPLQSGSDRILRRMNRQYDVAAYLEMIAAVETALTVDGLPPAVTTDVICGFPGETDADFEATVAVARRVGYLHMHVFPYSARAGTAAARWHDAAVPEATKRARVRTLIDLEDDPAGGLALRFRRRLLGRTVRVIVEGPDADDPSRASGRCDHYARVHLPGPLPRGRLVEATVVGVRADRVAAEPRDASVPLPVLA